MDAKKLEQLSKFAAPKKLGAYLARKKMAMASHAPHGGGKTGVETIRQQIHDGHKIVIRTTYQIEVDGKVLKAPIGVDDFGPGALSFPAQLSDGFGLGYGQSLDR